MSACWFTVFIGIAVLLVGGGGSVKVGLGHGIVVSGVVGGVIIVLGLMGLGC